MPQPSVALRAFALLAACFVPLPAAQASQASDPSAVDAVRAAVAAELHASQTDKSTWAYRESNTSDGRHAVYDVIETPRGSVRRMIELNGQPLTGDAAQAELDRMRHFVNDPSAQAKARKAAAHDDAQATELLKMLPDAFIWTRAGGDSDSETLNFRPNPDFNPPDMQSRVLGVMEGQIMVTREGHRIRTLRGKLSEDVKFGWGILGKLNHGGTFDVERRQVGAGVWQITETHVHIGGHALLFKTIGQQEDDVKTDFKPSTAKTLQAAAQQLESGPGASAGR